MEYEIFVYLMQMWDNFMNDTLLCIIPIVSNLNKKRLSKSDKENLTLSEIQKETLIGVLLGDAHLSRPKPTHNTKLVFDQSNSLHKEYLLHLYDVFKSLTNTEPYVTNRKPDTRTGKVYNSIRFSTLSLPCLNDYYELFYKDGRKIIPNNISELLTARGLAYLIMDDGGKSYYGQTIIHTRFYTKLEVELLQETLFKNFGLTSRLEEKSKDQWILYIQVRQDVKNKLSNLVKPYMHDSMMYKL
jgi:hypothetical protein